MRNKRTTLNWPKRFVELHSHANDPRLRQYYAEGSVAADCLLHQAPLVALDFETTGLDPQQDDIVSIGLVPFSLQRIRIQEAQEWLVKPNQPLEQQSVVIHGITHNEVKSAPDLNIIIEPLLQALAGCIVVVHYRTIERQFIHHALMQRIQESLEFPVIDTMDIEQQALLRRQGLIGRVLRRPLESLRLSDCRRRYSLPFYSVHHALTDAVATAELFQAQVSYHYRDDVRVGDLWR